MNKTAIKNFAIWARNKLIADVSYRAGLMGITKEGISDALPQSTSDVEFYDIGTAAPYSIHNGEIRQRKSLVDHIHRKEKDSDYVSAYTSVIEEVAYTWFNRLIAIRFMEVNDYLPAHVRVLSSESGKMEPDLVTTPFDAELSFSDAEKQMVIQQKNDNKLDECFRMLFIKQCNSLHTILPRLFESTSDYSELLINISYIDCEGIVYHLVNDIEEDDFNIEKGGQVEIIGWLYQYYIAEPKEKLINAHNKYNKDDIPFVTQLFTSDWIVKFMVENSLLRLGKELGVSNQFSTKCEYYIEQECEAIIDTKTNISSVRVLDPCMGSGHILVYVFDVLMLMYESLGWDRRVAALNIVENNIYGLDIDERAAQIAYFSIMMKARRYNRKILNGETICHVYAIKESNAIDLSVLDLFGGRSRAICENIINAYKDAKIYGSVINYDFDEKELLSFEKECIERLNTEQIADIFEARKLSVLKSEILPLIAQAKMWAYRYDVTITNPPYMSASLMPDELKKYVNAEYKDFRSDMFSCIAKRCIDWTKNNGQIGLLMPYVWMFVSAYKDMRKSFYKEIDITALVQLEYNAFEAACVPVAAFTAAKRKEKKVGTYIRLSDFKGSENQAPKTLEAIEDDNCKYKFNACMNDFLVIPDSPIAYWCSDPLYDVFKNANKMKDFAVACRGTVTGDDARFLKMWFEIPSNEFSEFSSYKKWIPMNKGGEFRRWYGNNSFVVNWENDGHEIKNFKDNKGKLRSRPQNINYFFIEAITWTYITSYKKCFRYYPNGFAFSGVGPGIFVNKPDTRNYILAYCNSVVFDEISKLIGASTLSLESGEVEKSPVIMQTTRKERIDSLAQENILLSKTDWDSFEESWEFKRHPLV